MREFKLKNIRLIQQLKLFGLFSLFLIAVLFFDCFNIEKFNFKEIQRLEQELKMAYEQIDQLKELEMNVLDKEKIDVDIKTNTSFYYKLGIVFTILAVGGLYFYFGFDPGGVEDIVSNSTQSVGFLKNSSVDRNVIYGDSLKGPSIEEYISYTPPGSPDYQI